MLARQNGTRVIMTVHVNSHVSLSGCGWTSEDAERAVGPCEELFPLLDEMMMMMGERVEVQKRKVYFMTGKERRIIILY